MYNGEFLHGGVKLTFVSLAERQTVLLGIESWQYPEIFLFLKRQACSYSVGNGVPGRE